MPIYPEGLSKSSPRLFAGAFDGSIGTKHTAISWFRFELFSAFGTDVKKLACTGGHLFFFFKAAVWAFNCRF